METKWCPIWLPNFKKNLWRAAGDRQAGMRRQPGCQVVPRLGECAMWSSGPVCSSCQHVRSHIYLLSRDASSTVEIIIPVLTLIAMMSILLA